MEKNLERLNIMIGWVTCDKSLWTELTIKKLRRFVIEHLWVLKLMHINFRNEVFCSLLLFLPCLGNQVHQDSGSIWTSSHYRVPEEFKCNYEYGYMTKMLLDDIFLVIVICGLLLIIVLPILISNSHLMFDSV